MSPVVVIAFLLLILYFVFWDTNPLANFEMFSPSDYANGPIILDGGKIIGRDARGQPIIRYLKVGDTVQTTIENNRDTSNITCSDSPGSTQLLLKGVVCKVNSNSQVNVKWTSVTNLHPSQGCVAKGIREFHFQRNGDDARSIRMLGDCNNRSIWGLSSLWPSQRLTLV